MYLWSNSSLATYVNFLCICVDDKGVALKFGQMFKLGGDKCINGWIKNGEDMPSYGQLGCGGFIIVGPNNRLISKKTPPFTQYGEAAFRFVEDLLRKEIQGAIESGELSSTSEEGVKTAADAEIYPYSDGSLVIVEDESAESEDYKSVPVIAKVIKFDTTEKQYLVEVVNDGVKKFVSPCGLAPYTPPPVEDNDDDQASPSDEDKFSFISVPASVGNVVIDDEHENCTNALNELLQEAEDAGDVDVISMDNALVVLELHFAHEEKLLKEHGFGKGAAFSAMEGHQSDHRRILSIARDAIDKAESDGKLKALIQTLFDVTLSFAQYVISDFPYVQAVDWLMPKL
jgi:hemerythrin